MDVIRAGRSVLLSEPPLYEAHLWFILTDPDQAKKVVAVMLRTPKPYTDPTLLLEVGDHPFIRHQSCVHFPAAQRLSVSEITAAIKSGRCHLKEDMSRELLVRVRAGLLASPRTVRAIADFCRKIWLNVAS